jgi:hypothetical protein
MSRLFLLFAGLAAAGALVGFLAALVFPPVAIDDHPFLPDPLPGRWALLVGVTRYDHLPPAAQLSGPGNDVAALREVLLRRYRFPAERIVTLTEDHGRRPTRAAIERAFRRLAEEVQAGDQVVILLAGHGDRQPEADPPHPEHPEPDGIDDVFLPADVKPWDERERRLPNALLDDEIGDWLEALTRKQAYVWAVFDCCHSGHLTRGSEVVRQPPAGTLVPAAVLEQARERAARRRLPGKPGKSTPFLPRHPSERLVALSACLPHETTTEAPFPPGAADAKVHGLLTWSLVGLLEQSASSADPPTYRELVRRLQLRYAARPGGGPTPTLEGGGQDRVVLGTERPARPRLTLRKHEGAYLIDAGGLHGLTPGSVLEVYSPAGETVSSKLLGHVRVRFVHPFDAVVAPCPYAGRPAPRDLPSGAACQVVYTDYRLSQVLVGVQAGKGQKEAAALVRKALRPRRDADGGLVRLVDDPLSAAWVVRLDGPTPALVEASGNREYPLPQVGSASFGRKLRDRLQRVARARNLLAVSERLERDRSAKGKLDLAVEVVLGDEVLPAPPGGWVFRPGDKVSFRVRNTSPKERCNIHLLVVDPDFAIHAMYPARDEVCKVLEPGQVLQSQAGEIDDKPPFGRDYLVAIATPARNPPVDFGPLLQKGLRERGFAAGAAARAGDARLRGAERTHP